MSRIEIINRELTELKVKKLTAVGSVLRETNRRIVSIENVLLREMNYPRGGETSMPTTTGTNGKNGKDGRDGVDGKDGLDGVDGEKGADGKDIDPVILNGKLDFVLCGTFQDLPQLPVSLPTLAIVAFDDTNDNTETVYLSFGSTRKLLVTVAG